MILYDINTQNNGDIIGDIYNINYNENDEEYHLKKQDRIKLVSVDGSIGGFQSFISEYDDSKFLLTWNDYIFPENTFNAQVWKIEN